MVLPCASVMVTMVLLNEAFTCATPAMMFLRSRRRGRGAVAAAAPVAAAGLAMIRFLLDLLRDFLLASNRLGGPFAGARIGVGALAADRQPAAMPQAPVAGEVHQSLDVHRHFAAQVALDRVVAVDGLADADDLVVGQRIDPPRLVDPDFAEDFPSLGRADPVAVLQPHP